MTKYVLCSPRSSFRNRVRFWIAENFVTPEMFEKLEDLDPNSFSAEEISSIHWIPRWFAKLVLRRAVRDGKFIQNSDGTFGLAKDGG